MRYFYHPESESYYLSDDDSVGDGMQVELDRDEFLEGLAYEALQNAAQNDASVPDDDVELAREMISGGVFALGGGEDGDPEVLSEDGDPLDDVVRAAGRARRLRRDEK